MHCGETYYYVCNKSYLGGQVLTVGCSAIGWMNKNYYCDGGLSQWLCGLRLGSSGIHFLGLWV